MIIRDYLCLASEQDKSGKIIAINQRKKDRLCLRQEPVLLIPELDYNIISIFSNIGGALSGTNTLILASPILGGLVDMVY